MRTKQASSSNWIGEPRLSSHPRLRFFDMAPHQMQETKNPKFTSTPSPRHRFHVEISLPQGPISSRPHETHSRLHHRSTSALQIPANAPRILSRATSRGFGTKPRISLRGPRGARKEKSGTRRRPGSPCPCGTWNCGPAPAETPGLPSFLRLHAFASPGWAMAKAVRVPYRARY